MVETDTRNADQATSWNGLAGRRWVERQGFMDQLLAPVSAALFDTIELKPGTHVLDIGCGSGDTTLELARRVGPGGRVTGLDISAPLLARARQRAAADGPVSFVEADATLYAFAPGDADLLFSRFGVMFFADPVRAFTNMRKGLKPGARLCFACWRDPKLSPSLSLPIEVLRPLLPPQPVLDPEAPGPFAFADSQKVAHILDAAGFTGISARPVDLLFDAGVGGGLDAAVASALEIGPASRALADQPAEIRAVATAAIRTALEPFVKGDRVEMASAIWIVTAGNP
jgi:SAM-dependent methyltransferase